MYKSDIIAIAEVPYGFEVYKMDVKSHVYLYHELPFYPDSLINEFIFFYDDCDKDNFDINNNSDYYTDRNNWDQPRREIMQEFYNRHIEKMKKYKNSIGYNLSKKLFK